MFATRQKKPISSVCHDYDFPETEFKTEGKIKHVKIINIGPKKYKLFGKVKARTKTQVLNS